MWPHVGARGRKTNEIMDLRILRRRSLAVVATLCVAASANAEEKTVWLVRPLYPGQDTLIERTEKALDKLMPGDARKSAIIGKRELAAALKSNSGGELPCFGVEARCADPIDPFIASFGFERVVMIQGGQDEAGYKYRVVSYDPKSGRSTPATSSNAILEKALLGAVAKVVAAASTLDVKSSPPGATVYIDDVKVGVTPLNTQVLPGERVVKLDLKLHQPIEETIVIPIRGTASLDKTLEKVAARILISASPAGTEIFLDGVSAGKDKIDRGIAPGEHTVRLVADGYKAFEQSISVKPDQQFNLEKSLDPLPGTVPPALLVVNGKAIEVAPPKQLTLEETIYERRSYFHASFEFASFTGRTLIGRRFDNAPGRTTLFSGPNPTMIGAGIEYGTGGKHFGVSVFGLSYLTNVDAVQMEVGHELDKPCEMSNGMCAPTRIEGVRLHMASLKLLQPQFRFVVWRFQFGVQLGLEGRVGWINGHDPGDPSAVTYKDGFMTLDLMASARLNVRFYVVDGLFVHLQGNYAQALVGWDAIDDTGKKFNALDASTAGLNLGVGYAF